MCGRFTLYSSAEELETEFGFPFPFIQPNYNVAPTQNIMAIVGNQAETKAGWMHWGLVPYWAKEKKIRNRMINARSETADEKPAFKRLLANRRCLVVANRFYEWKREQDSKHPYLIGVKNSPILTFAGLWDRWKDPATGEVLISCTILTTAPNDFMSDLHDRMPVILNEGNRQAWLDADIRDSEKLKQLLVPYSSDHMTAYEVSKAVNNPRNNEASLIEPLV
ncbi:putative SOS response-associated peptidase YedK [Alkalihalobacillus xiaoxiensis]|uniref:Abasic site processing protein n=1 Tax=Shouchella xiaoxiensis TaxID=766895 RepID=A0ABS2SPZ8_9BACI|nr:SOS response-associated peptidase [Shouchella xiaoxiensis]MBM7837241.1 putative SOS response-associated peptidase YedK [Shouchella xiaoxiensis]